jgi:hypothetical protein
MMMNRISIVSIVNSRQVAWRRMVLSRCWSSSDGNHGGINSDATPATTTSTTTSKSTKKKRLDGITDVLSIPNKPMPLLKPGFQPTGTNKDGVYMGSTFLMLSPQTLPELDCAPVLNKTLLTRKVGTSKHGSDAAIRLCKAKKELRQVIQQELVLATTTTTTTEENKTRSWSSSTNGQGSKKMYLMRRHGVPNQLLQHLITVADRWLEQKNALELCVDSSCQNNSLSVFTTEGASWRTLWPKEWDDDVALYLAIMKRMVSHLATITPFCCCRCCDEDGGDTNSLLRPEDLEWKVSISRHNKLPLTLFPNDPEILPVIEWVTPTLPRGATNAKETTTTTTTTTNISSSTISTSVKAAPRKIGKIIIRMQGAAKPIIPGEEGNEYLKQSHDASFIFEANFDATTATTTTTAIQSEN